MARFPLRLTLSMLAAALWWTAAAPGAAQETARLPADIDAYYRDANFVAALSTVEERERLFAGQGPDSVAPATRERLARVRDALERLKGRVWQPLPPGGRPRLEDLRAGSAWRTVVRARLDAETAMLRIRLDPIPERLRQEWIAAFEARGLEPDLDPEAGEPGFEMHFWFAVEGRWVRKVGGIAQFR